MTVKLNRPNTSHWKIDIRKVSLLLLSRAYFFRHSLFSLRVVSLPPPRRERASVAVVVVREAGLIAFTEALLLLKPGLDTTVLSFRTLTPLFASYISTTCQAEQRFCGCLCSERFLGVDQSEDT